MNSDPNQQYGGGGGYPPQQPGYPPQQPGYPPGGAFPMHGGYPQGGGGGYPPPPNQGPYGQQGGYGPPPNAGFMPPPQDPYGYQPQDGGYGGGDPEDPNKGFGFDDATIRRGFIRKVYSILMVQLAVTFGFMSLFVFHAGTRNWARANPAYTWVALAVLIVTLIAMACCESVRRKTPMNYIFLGLFTLAQTFMLGMTTSRVPPETVMIAVGVTAVVCLALTLFAFQTKWDFTVMGGVLMVALVVLMIFGILCIFIRGDTMRLVYACLGALIFCFYLIYDTQLMMGGKHKYSISPEEYVFAALNLYLDVVNLFMYILMIVSASRD